MKPRKYYAHNLNEIRPDTKLIEAKLRQYFEITDQRYEPSSSKNVMLVSFEALGMLAKSNSECTRMNEQWRELVAMSVVTLSESSVYVTTPFAANYVLPNEDGYYLAAEVNWNPYEALNNHRSFRHNNLTEENVIGIQRKHRECAEKLEEEYGAMLECLKNKYAK